MSKQLCRDCKHLQHDSGCGIWCGVSGNNKNYDCTKYERKGDDGKEMEQLFMSMDRDDCYDECKNYVICTLVLEWIDDYLKYDYDESILDGLRKHCHESIEFYEKEHYGRILR